MLGIFVWQARCNLGTIQTVNKGENRKMRTCRILIIRSTSFYGGAERQIVGFASRLDKRLFDPVICGFKDDIVPGNAFLKIAAEQGLATALILSTKGFDAKAINDLSAIVTSEKVDLLCPQDYRADFYARIVGHRLKIPVVATAHGFTGHTRNVQLYEAFDRLIVLRGMNRVICVSQAVVERLRRCGIPRTKLKRVYNSIDVMEADPPIDKPRGSITVCSVGRLSVEKGHRFLIQAWQTICKRFPSARLLLVGDGPERARLSELALDLGIASSVEFAGFTDTPMDYIYDSDVFVLPSLTEGLPVVILEACAASKPIVASNVGGIGEVISSGRSGILVNPGRPNELVSAILSLLEHPGNGSSMGDAARKVVEDEFSFEKNVPLLEQAYLPFVDSSKVKIRGRYTRGEDCSHSLDAQ
jgi:glycosyltransferase involved in cell wall biosynthesis